MLSKGDRLNKYEIIGEIAQGGEAIVYRALDTFTQSKVALKVIHERNVRLEPEISKLFLREGKILSEIDNPNIIKVYESNIAQVNGKEYFYHAMELVDSPTLEDWLKQNKPGWKEIIRILRAIASAVDILHNREDPILHRDLKPSNIFLLDSGDDQNPAQVIIFDFGLAKCEYERTITAPDAFRGTVMYAAPECMKIGGKASTASDIYCLGRVLEQMLGEDVPKDYPRWIIDLKKIMCDTVPQNRPTAEEVVQIIDEQVESRSWVSKSLTKLVSLKNKIRLRRWRILIRVASIIAVILIICVISYLAYIRAKPGLKMISMAGKGLIKNGLSISVSGNNVYLGDGFDGVRVYQIHDHGSLELVNTIPEEKDGFVLNVTIHGEYAFVCDGLLGLKIFNISNPISPRLVGAIDTDEVNVADTGAIASDVVVSGNYAYLADELKGVSIIDISDVTRPRKVGSLKSDHYTYGISVQKNHAYVADGNAGFKVIDISNPGNPVLISQIRTTFAKDVVVAGKYAYVADGKNGLIVIDISNPSMPTQIAGAHIDSEQQSVNLTLSGNYVYVADSLGGLIMVDVTNPTHPVEVDRVKINKLFVDVDVEGDYVYAVVAAYGLIVYRHQREWKWF